MRLAKTHFFCKECGNEYSKWQGKCNGCNQWNTIVEANFTEVSKKRTFVSGLEETKAKRISEITVKGEKERIACGYKNLDVLFGGGIMKGSVTLLSGEPGIGKSTLILQILDYISRNYGDVLYQSGEESDIQIKQRIERLEITSEKIHIIHTQDLQVLLNEIERIKPVFFISDSIQTIQDYALDSEMQSPSQIKHCSAEIIRVSKMNNTPSIIIGHVNKDDKIAGPKLLEHMVDVIIKIEGDEGSDLRIVRSNKNRFGEKEVCLFEMTQKGLMEISNPSEYLMNKNGPNESGSIISCITEHRPILLEVQALVSPLTIENMIPRRTVEGYFKNRLNIILAVIEKKANIRMGNKDVFLNVVGGMNIKQRSADLSVALSIISSDKEIPIPKDVLVIGEIGLSGEIRAISKIENIIKEAERNGMTKCILPKGNLERAKSVNKNMKLIGVETLNEAINIFFK